jgi:hypothetical protein
MLLEQNSGTIGSENWRTYIFIFGRFGKKVFYVAVAAPRFAMLYKTFSCPLQLFLDLPVKS